MATVKYNNEQITPSPAFSVTRSNVWLDNDTELSKVFEITLDGSFVPATGGVVFDSGTTNADDRMEYLFRKANSLRSLFADPGKLLEIKDNSDNVVISCLPVQITVNLPENFYTTNLDYSITCQAYNISSYANTAITETSAYQVKSANDTWNFNIGEDSITAQRNIDAVGQGDGLSTTTAITNASSWCHNKFDDVSYISSIQPILSSVFGDTFDSYSVNSMSVDKSIEAGSYSINTEYLIPRETGAYIETYTLNILRSADEFISLNATYNVKGIGNNFTTRLSNAKTRFSDLTQSGIIADVFTAISGSIPFTYPVNNLSYTVDSFTPTVSKPQGELSYSINYNITNLDTNTYLDNIKLQTNVGFDFNTGKFNLGINGSQANLSGDWVPLTVPTYANIINYLSNKSIVPSSWQHNSTIINIDKNYSQNNALMNWSMRIEGDAIATSELPIMIDTKRRHNISPRLYREEISETIVITVATSVFDYNTFDLDYSTLAALTQKKNDYIEGGDKPSSIYFTGVCRVPSMGNISVADISLSNGNTIRYDINRNWVLYPWEISLLSTSIPLETFEVHVTRNFGTLQGQSVMIPGRQYGPIFQNLKTMSSPSISISISLSVGRDLSSSMINLTGEFTAAAGSDRWRSDIPLSDISDQILNSIVGTGITIDRNVALSELTIDGPLALVKNETDNYSPTNNSFAYNIVYSLINMNYRT